MEKLRGEHGCFLSGRDMGHRCLMLARLLAYFSHIPILQCHLESFREYSITIQSNIH
jgi:hypothetical protein